MWKKEKQLPWTLVGRLDLMENSFTLAPDEEKNVRYLVRIKQPGRYEGKIRVGFAREDGEGSGVGTTYTLIIIAEGTGEKFVPDSQDLEEQNNEEKLSDEAGSDNTNTVENIVNKQEGQEGDGVSVSFGNTKPPVQKQPNTNLWALIFVLVIGVVITLGVFVYLRRVLK